MVSLQSSDRFDIKITRRTGAAAWASGDIEKNPVGHPILKRQYNRPDECTFFIEDIDENDVDIDLDEVERGDEILLSIDQNEVFFGEVINKIWRSREGDRIIEIFAMDFARLGAEFQLDRIVHNGYLDLWLREVDANYETEIKFGIQAPNRIERFVGQGIINTDNRQTAIQVNPANLRVFFDNGGTNRQLAVSFTPQSRLIEGIYLPLLDPNDGTNFPNTNILTGSITLALEQVDANGEPTGNQLLLEDGVSFAERKIGNDIKEGWFGASGTNVISGNISGADMTWAVSRIGSNSNVDIIADGVMGKTNIARLQYDDGDTEIKILTTDPSSANDPPTKTWFRIECRPSQNTMEARIKVSVSAPGSKEAFTIIVKDTDSFITHNENPTTGADLTESWSGGDILYFYVRIDYKRMLFDIFTGVRGSDVFVKRFENLEFVDKDSFVAVPSEMREFEIKVVAGSPTANFDVGWVSGNEIAMFAIGEEEFPHWAYFDFRDNRIPVEVNGQYAMVLRFDTIESANDESIQWNALASRNEDFLNFISSDGGSTWAPLPSIPPLVGATLMFQIEYSDSWQLLREDDDFIIDRTTKKLILSPAVVTASREYGGTFKTGLIEERTFPNLRVSEYSNLDQDGIVVDDVHGGPPITAHQMTLADVVKYLISFIPGWGSTPIVDGTGSGTDDAIDFGFHDAVNFLVNTHIVKQRTINEALKDLANQFGATFFVSNDGLNNITFEKVTDIADIDITSLDPHEHVVSNDDSDGDPFITILTNEVGRKEEQTFTTFTVKGGGENLQATFVNWVLVAAIGKEIIRKPEVFSKEFDIDNLWRYVKLLNEIYGVQRFEGKIVVADYFPTFNNRLDTNGILRIIDDRMEDGELKTGILNVFRIFSLEYNGMDNQTRIFVSNSSRNTELLHLDLAELKNILNDVDPVDPEKHIAIHTNADPPPILAIPAGEIYMALDDTQNNELDTLRYRRIPVYQNSYTDGGVTFTALTAFFDTGVGTIRNDRLPIGRFSLYTTPTGGSPIFSSSTFIGQKNLYKWNHVSLYATIWVKDS